MPRAIVVAPVEDSASKYATFVTRNTSSPVGDFYPHPRPFVTTKNRYVVPDQTVELSRRTIGRQLLIGPQAIACAV